MARKAFPASLRSALTLALLCGAHPVAYAAYPMSLRGDACVFGGDWMTSRAVRAQRDRASVLLAVSDALRFAFAGPAPHAAFTARVGVPLGAKEFQGAERCGAPAVLCSRHRFQMRGVAAMSHAADVVDLHPVRYRTDEQFVDDTVDASLFALPLDRTVAVSGESSAHPLPASVIVDEDACGNSLGQVTSSHVTNISKSMHTARKHFA